MIMAFSAFRMLNKQCTPWNPSFISSAGIVDPKPEYFGSIIRI
jgi:hypothetical protein